jgi:hypothetical protein
MTGDRHIKADLLKLDAAERIDLATEVASIEALITGTGDLRIQEADSIDIKSVDVRDGKIDIQANGAITVDQMTGPGDVNIYSSQGDMALRHITANNITVQSLSGDMHLNALNATQTIHINMNASGQAYGSSDAIPDIKAHTFTTNMRNPSMLNLDVEHIDIQNKNIITFKDYLQSNLHADHIQKIVLDDYYQCSVSLYDSLEEEASKALDLTWVFQAPEDWKMLDTDAVLKNSYIPFDSDALLETDSEYEVKWAEFDIIAPDQVLHETMPDNDQATDTPDEQHIESRGDMSRYSYASRDQLQPEKGFFSKLKGFWKRVRGANH